MGRKKKPGPRYPSGKLKSLSVVERLKEVEAKRYRENMAFAAAQPHRRDFADPLSDKLGSALGRFCERHGLRSELYEGGRKYADLVRRWRIAKGCPDPHHQVGIGSGQGPSDEVVADWWEKIQRLERAVLSHGQIAYLAVRHLCVDDSDITEEAREDATVGLRVLAQELGMIQVGAHPFARSAA